jgi:hypothetical protein
MGAITTPATTRSPRSSPRLPTIGALGGTSTVRRRRCAHRSGWPRSSHRRAHLLAAGCMLNGERGHRQLRGAEELRAASTRTVPGLTLKMRWIFHGVCPGGAGIPSAPAAACSIEAFGIRFRGALKHSLFLVAPVLRASTFQEAGRLLEMCVIQERHVV